MSFHYGSRKGCKIEWIVCHYPVAPGCNAWWCYNYYERTNEAKSAHYAVSTTETVSIIPCAMAAWHCSIKDKQIYCGANNYNSIGIDLMDNKLNKKSMSVKDKDCYEDTTTQGATEARRRAALAGAGDYFLKKLFDTGFKSVYIGLMGRASSPRPHTQGDHQ